MSEILNTKVQDVPVGRLTPHPKNPRVGNLEAIRRSIEVNGFYGVIVAQKGTGYILAGNHRYLAAKDAGMKSVPVAWVDVDDERAERILAADNRTADLAGYDEGSLAELLQELAETTAGLEGTGYSAADLEEILDSVRAATAGGFLNDAINGDGDEDGDEAGGDADEQGDDGEGREGGGEETFFPLNYTVTRAQREDILGAIRAAQRKWGYRTSAEALHRICCEFSAGHSR